MFTRADLTDTAMSFSNYKIDYNRRLDSGVFGTVSAVVDRPENTLHHYITDRLFNYGTKAKPS